MRNLNKSVYLIKTLIMSSKFFGNRTTKNEDKSNAKKAPKDKGSSRSNTGVRKVGRGK